MQRVLLWGVLTIKRLYLFQVFMFRNIESNIKKKKKKFSFTIKNKIRLFVQYQ